MPKNECGSLDVKRHMQKYFLSVSNKSDFAGEENNRLCPVSRLLEKLSSVALVKATMFALKIDATATYT